MNRANKETGDVARRAGRDRKAFSLIELLVVIAIIGVLLAIALPALSYARHQAAVAQSMSNVRGVAVVFDSYQSSEGVYPFLPAGGWLLVGPSGSGGLVSSTNPWSLRLMWPAMMHDVAPWESHYASWLNRRADRGDRPWIDPEGRTLWPSYFYTRSFQARPQAWPASASAPPWQGEEADLLKPVGLSDVRFPSSKAIVVDRRREYLPRDLDARRGKPRAVGSVDGAVSMRHNRDATAPVANAVDGADPLVYDDTPGGVRGRDY
ncbi:MAG: type II secretion system protein [Phycisphaerales bacterium]|nr:type II secretion system protein [Phycisphaerales bacterium]